MTGKIFKSILVVTLSALIAAACAFFGISLENIREFDRRELEQATIVAANAAEMPGTERLASFDGADIRITLLSGDGDVIYANHDSTEQAKLAAASGEEYIESALGDDGSLCAYFIKKLDNGNVICASETIESTWSVMKSMLVQMVVIFIIVLALAGVMASVIASRIVHPLSELDPTHPETLVKYKELAPVAKRLEDQNMLILRKIEELKLKQTEFAAITDNMSEGMVIIDSEAEVLSYNKSAEKMLASYGEMPKNISDVNAGFGFGNAVADALSGKKTVDSFKADGRYYSVIINPVIHESSVEGAVIVILDETEKEQREALRREFTSNISHELKTPLTSISGFAEIIMGGLADGDEKRFAGNIYREAQRLIVLVGDIIELNRLDGGVLTFDDVPVGLYDICETVIERLSVIAEKSDITLSLEGERISIPGNSRVIEEMIYNLVDNGIKYNNPGGNVSLRVFTDEHRRPSVSCSDNGIGIPDSQKGRVFERFFRVDKSRSKAIGGTGLGLSIVKHGANCHGAEISLSGHENEGTQITVAFRAE